MRVITSTSIFLLFCLFGGERAAAQLMPETAFYWENPYRINPASIRFDYTAFFTLSARKQWDGIQGAPTTFVATGSYYLEAYRMQGGLKLMSDKIGYVSVIDISMSYGYALQLGRESYLNLGIAGVYQSQSVDRGDVAFDGEDEPLLSNTFFNNFQKWNASLGIEYTYGKSFIVGASCQNLFSFLEDENSVFGGVNYFYGRYRTHYLGRGFEVGRYRTRSIERSYDFEVGVCLKQYKEEVEVDGIVTLYVNRDTQKEKFQLSLLGRSVGEVGVLAGIKLKSELKFLCVYEYNFRALQQFSNGSFEVMVSYPIKVDRSRRCVPIF